MIFSGSGSDLRILSDGTSILVVWEDRVIVLDEHFVKNFMLGCRQNMIDVTNWGDPFRKMIPGVMSVDMDFSITCNGQPRIIEGKDAIKQFDLFRHFSVMDLFRQINVKLNGRK